MNFDTVEQFLKWYDNKHARCPNCGIIGNFSSDSIKCLVDLDKIKYYKNKNKCTCLNCGDIHIKHDREPLLRN